MSKFRQYILGTRRGLLLLLLVAAGIIYGITRMVNRGGDADGATAHFDVPPENVFIFKGLQGPAAPSVIRGGEHISWRKYGADNPSAMVILLTDTTCQWIGLAHGLTNIGVPFIITTSTAEALRHKVVMVYPMISGRVLAKEELQAIAAIPRNGGVLIATNVYGGGLNEVFDYADITAGNKRDKIVLNTVADPQIEKIFTGAINRELLLAGTDTMNDVPTVGYTSPKTPLATFDDGTGCIVYKDYGKGKAYALGLDLGNYFLRYMNGRGYEANRAYVNRYDAGIDIWLRMLKQIYMEGEENAVTISAAPYNKPFTMTITHDIDFTRSIVNAAQYAKMEDSLGVKATYFIQTKYVKDWNDDIFFNDANIQYLQQTAALGMEIGSHSVSHSRVFSKFKTGTGKESYPDYKPFVKERLVTYNASILGELRISKFLLESYVKGLTVRSFRPGHLQYPFALPQSLAAAGYSNNSAVTGGVAQTNLPYILMYNREFDAETGMVEVPIAVEDELGLPMLQRLDSTVLLANQLAEYGGVLNILIHTDILGQKYEYERKVIGLYKDKAWVSTIGDFGDWWRGRNAVKLSVVIAGGAHRLTVTGPTLQTVKGLTLQVPAGWRLVPADGVSQQGNAIVINELKGETVIICK
ncbi:MAG: polysaccharide deacetylase family protein [Bacteroidota bacterium]